MHACIHTYIHTYIHIHIHTYTYMHACEDASMNTFRSVWGRQDSVTNVHTNNPNMKWNWHSSGVVGKPITHVHTYICTFM